MPPTVITIDHPSPSNSSSRSSFTEGGSSTGTGVHVSNPVDSQEDSDLLDDTWDPDYSEDIEPSESASRSRASQQYRTSSQPAPSIRRGHSRRQATSDHSSHPSASRSRRPGAPNPPSSVASIEDYPGYGRGYPPQHPHYAGRGAPPPGYPPSFASGYNQNPFGATAGTVVPFGPPGAHGYPQNPFSPAGAGPPGYFPPGAPYPIPGQPTPGTYGGHEIMPYGQAPAYGGYPPYGMPHPGAGTPGNGSPYYHYSVQAPARAESPAPTPAPAPAPKVPTPAPAPTTDPEIEKKLADLQKQLEESRKAFNDKLAAEEKAKADAAHAAATNQRVAEEVAKVTAKMQEDAKAKETADAKAKFEAEVAAAAKAKADEEKAKAEAAAKAKFAAEVKAKYDEEIRAAAAKVKADAEKAKAEADAKAKYEAELKAKYEEEVKAAKAEAEAAKALAAPPKEEKKKPIKFKDAVGRKFSFPFDLCQTWQGMEDLIRQAFLHVDVIGPHVQDGHYDLIGPNGEIILPQVWETMIEPDWAITMHMWPMPEPPKPAPEVPPAPPQHHGPPPTRSGRHGHLQRPPQRSNRERRPPSPGWIGPPVGGAGGMPAGVVVVDNAVPKPKKKAEKSSWGLFGGGSKNTKGAGGKGRAKK